MTDAAPTTPVELAADIVSAYVSKNSVRAADLPDLLKSVHDALSSLVNPLPPAAEETPKATPAQIKKSITPDTLISFLDGKPYKSLKRHLTKHGMTPEEYRTKFGLPRDYPMVAASYAAQRSELAKSLGLGQRRRERAAAKAAAPDAAVKGPAKRGRKPKAAADE
ncbi:MAG: MucR family transcriptional regulator [Methylobacterium sp.]|uniref:MucR family transcriptional regulator n=1 Tax=Methylobacterium sp. TaxID=409 RepID=UPI0025879C49|nr:MucR family transcriptional regulator [Methylobacterium sp.]MBY0297432.1 MucR family transcriptional regulator [Methylobacterium sp.]